MKENIKYLDDGYKRKLKCLEKDFGVKYFKGKTHQTSDAYLNTMYKDKSLRPLIDKNSELGQEIQQTAQREMQLQQSRGSGLSL